LTKLTTKTNAEDCCIPNSKIAQRATQIGETGNHWHTR